MIKLKEILTAKVLNKTVQNDPVLRKNYTSLRRNFRKRYPNALKKAFIGHEKCIPRRAYSSWMWEGLEETKKCYEMLRREDIKLGLQLYD